MTPTRAGTTVFPLPAIPFPRITRSCSRRLRQRYARAMAATSLANNCLTALNGLSSSFSSSILPLSNVTYSRTKTRLSSFIYQCSTRFLRRQAPSSDEPLHCGPQPNGPYCQTCTAIPLVADQVSLPDVAGTVPLLSLLPVELVQLYSSPAQLILNDLARKPAPRAVLCASQTEYVAVIKRMMAVGMVSFTTQPAVVNGVFGVAKGDGSMRLIIDARPANSAFVDSPQVHLPTPDLTAHLEIPADSPLYVAKVDLDNFYHRLRLPDWMHRFFALPPILSQELGVNPMFGFDVMVFPCCTTLPMGWSHSVFVAQSVHEFFLDVHTNLRREDRITHSADLKVNRIRHQVYIDDLLLFGLNSEEVGKVQQSYLDALWFHNLPPKLSKVVRPTSQPVECLGMEIDGRAHTVGLAVPKLQRLCAMTLELIQMGSCSGESMERLLGGWTWACLACRPALAVFSAVYRFVQLAGRKEFAIWNSVQNELLTIVALAPVLFSSLSAPWLDRIVASDASETGCGVVTARVNGVNPGDVAISPESMVGQLKWSEIISSRWNQSEHINVLELRSLTAAVKWILSRRRSIGFRALILCDSQVVVGAVSKGRSSSHQILRRLRTLSAMVLGSGLRLCVKWIPSLLNPADDASRR
jgi:hypothetical protein